jgi:hypothetical protein
MTKTGYQFVRYADDVVILCRSEEEARMGLFSLRTILWHNTLQLTLFPAPQ